MNNGESASNLHYSFDFIKRKRYFCTKTKYYE